MNIKKLKFLALLLTTFSLISCSNEDNYQSQDTNYTVPETYTFERNGTTTVDFSGQAQRILMLDEIGNYVMIRNVTFFSSVDRI